MKKATDLATELAAGGLRPVPLGEVLPPTPHSVFVSMPTMADVIGYEEKEERVCRQMQGGYPRFVTPSLTHDLECLLLEDILQKEKGNQKYAVRLLSSERMGQILLTHLPPEAQAKIHTDGKLYWISFLGEDSFCEKVQMFMQHTGAMVFSREAESHLLEKGELKKDTGKDAKQEFFQKERFKKKFFQEELLPGSKKEVHQTVLEFLRKDLEAKKEDRLFLSRSGMSAFFAAYKAVSQMQQSRGRSIWIQLGWLYVDTMEVLVKFGQKKEDYVCLPDPLDISALQKFLESHGKRTAGVVVEAPTNPLLQTPDTAAVFDLCRKAGAALILDPSMAGMGNVHALPYCDVLVSSLTKYHGWSGDLIMGLAALNSQSVFYDELASLLSENVELPYEGDLRRLGFLQKAYPQILRKINKNTLRIAEFLSEHPRVRKVYWAYSPSSRKNYKALAKSSENPGGVLSFEIDMPLSVFYDRVALPKGPSFGTAFTLLCPFIYLAHYSLLKTKQGRKHLSENGLSPSLLRLSVGIEDAEDICRTLQNALEQRA